MKVQTSKNTYLIRWQMQWKLDGLPLPPSSLVENRPRRQCSTSSKPQSPNEPEKPVRDLFMAKKTNFLWAGQYFPSNRDILMCRYILKNREFIAIFWWRYIVGSFDSLYIADICNCAPDPSVSGFLLSLTSSPQRNATLHARPFHTLRRALRDFIAI